MGSGDIKSTSLLYRLETLKSLDNDKPVAVAEGEKASLAIVAASVNCVGTLGANTTPDDAVLTHLTLFRVVLWPDNHDEGRQHMNRIAARLLALGCRDVRVVDWPDAPLKGDAADFDGLDEGLRTLIEAAKPLDLAAIEKSKPDGPWPFVNADEFLAQGSGNDDAQFLVDGIVLCGGITVFSSVRGLAKTHIAHSIYRHHRS